MDFDRWICDKELGLAHNALRVKNPGDGNGFEYWFYKRVESQDTDTFLHKLLWEMNDDD